MCLSTEGFDFPKKFVVTKWSRLCHVVSEVLCDDNLDPGYEAMLCEESFSEYDSEPNHGYATYLWRRFRAMRFVELGEMDVFIPKR